MIYKGEIEDIERYFMSDAVSQSLIKNPRNKIRKAKIGLYYEEKRHFLMGSLIDVLIFTPERFNYYYFVDKLKNKPSANVMSIVKKLFDSLVHDEMNTDGVNNSGRLEDYASMIQVICDEQGFNMPRRKEYVSEDTRVRDVIKAGQEYWEHLLNCRGKQILSEDEYNEAMQCIDGIIGNYSTSFIVHNNENLNYYIQYPLYLEHEGVTLKALPDVFIHNPTEHPIKLNEYITILPNQIILIDLKTTSKYLDNIEEIILGRRYDIQLDFYKNIISKCFQVDDIETYIVINSLREPNYPELIYVNTTDVNYEKIGNWETMLEQTLKMLNNNYINPEIQEMGFRKANLKLYV